MAGEKHILVYIARHGTTDLNVAHAFRGPIDAPLDAKGHRDANQLGFYLSGEDISAIVHSDKKRTRATADAISKHHSGVPVESNTDLRAYNVGDLGGKPKNKENLDTVAWHVKHPDVPLPGGESFNNFRGRVRPVIKSAIDYAIQSGRPVVLVSHSSVIREVGSMIGGHHEYALVEPGGVVAVYVQNGKLDVEPVFKPRPRGDDTETIT